MEYLILLFIGIIAGIVAGLFGIGGGVVIVPSLVYIMNFPLIMANGTSLAALLLPVGIFAVKQYHSSGFVNIKTAAIISLGMLTGVFGGAEIAHLLSPNYLRMAYGFFLLYVTIKFIDFTSIINKFKKEKKSNILEKKDDEYEIRNVNIFLIYLFGIIAGIMSGMFGIGGGLIIVPFLLTVMNFHPKMAIGTSLASLLLPVGLPGIFVYYNAGNLNFIYAGMVALGIIIGSIFGAKISLGLPTKTVKKIYGYFVFIMAIDFIFF